jgi:hypothetical protein
MMDNTILYYNAKLIIVMQPEIATAEEAGRRFVIAAEVQNLASRSGF